MALGGSVRGAVVLVVGVELSRHGEDLLGDQGPGAAGARRLDLRLTTQRLDLDHAGTFDDLAAQSLHELDARAERATRRDEVIYQDHLVALLDNVALDTEAVLLIVLCLVCSARDGIRHLAALAHHEERDAHLDGHRREEEATGVETANGVDLHGLVSIRHRLAGLVKEDGVRKQPTNVVELLDALVGEVGKLGGNLLCQRPILLVCLRVSHCTQRTARRLDKGTKQS
mmetsp:Transcript_45986/g.103366  ORF Transcript_45986/g.103366 Transcript_45986/m.103366 type:complete len:228 (-) Transcript_45986:2-685(-)